MKNMDKLEGYLPGKHAATICVHAHPDGDAIGSGCALARYLRLSRGIDAVVLAPDPVPDSLKFALREGDTFLSYSECPGECEDRIAESDIIFCLDCNSFSRVAGAEAGLRASGAVKILIDHHLNPDKEAFDLVISETEISSTCELLYWTLRESSDVAGDDGKLPESCLDALMTGMTTDTNNFANSVYPGTLGMASNLLAAGVDRDAILLNLYNNYRVNRLRIIGHLLNDEMRITPEGAAFAILDLDSQRAFDFKEGEAEGFVNMPLAAAEIKLSVFMREEKDQFRVSVRSKKGVSANAFAMRYFDGGGHEQAAGGKLVKDESLRDADDARAYILKVTREFFGK